MRPIARHLCQASLVALLLSAVLVAGPAPAQPSFTPLDSGQWTFNKDCIAHGNTLAAALTDGVQLWDLGHPSAPALLGDYYAQARKTMRIDDFNLAGRRVADIGLPGDPG